MSLPSEIRHEIYTAIMQLPAQDHVSFLLACKQTNAECQRYLFKRPLMCSSIAELEAFVNGKTSRLLQHVTTLDLKLDDPDTVELHSYFETLMDSNLQNARAPFVERSQRIISCLGKFTNLQNLRLGCVNTAHSDVSAQIISSNILRWIGEHHPNIAHLAIAIEATRLDGVIDMYNLRSLRINAFGRTSPKDFTQIVSPLRRLEELVAIGPGEIYKWQQLHSVPRTLQQTVNAEVLRTITPLRKLTIYETVESDQQLHSLLNEETVTAIHTQHGNTLQHLHLSSGTALDAKLQALLMSSLPTMTNVKDLTLSWPNLFLEVINHLPPRCQHLTLRGDNFPHAMSLLCGLRDDIGQLSDLREVTICLAQFADLPTTLNL